MLHRNPSDSDKYVTGRRNRPVNAKGSILLQLHGAELRTILVLKLGMNGFRIAEVPLHDCCSAEIEISTSPEAAAVWADLIHERPGPLSGYHRVK
jgi:hypothetical protein